MTSLMLLPEETRPLQRINMTANANPRPTYRKQMQTISRKRVTPAKEYAINGDRENAAEGKHVPGCIPKPTEKERIG